MYVTVGTGNNSSSASKSAYPFQAQDFFFKIIWFHVTNPIIFGLQRPTKIAKKICHPPPEPQAHVTMVRSGLISN